MLKKTQAAVIAMAITTALSAQSVASGVSVKALPVGNVGVNFNKDNIFVNFGGPNVRLSRGANAISVGVYPSVRFRLDDNKPATASVVSTILGFGGSLYHKKFSFSYISYYPPAPAGATKPLIFHTFGIGYKIGG